MALKVYKYEFNAHNRLNILFHGMSAIIGYINESPIGTSIYM